MKLIASLIAALAALSFNSAAVHAALPSVVNSVESACKPSLIEEAMPINRGGCCRFACNQYKCFCLWWC